MVKALKVHLSADITKKFCLLSNKYDPYYDNLSAFYDKLEVQAEDGKPNHLIVAVSSDKGLCGGIHSSICKAIKAEMAGKSAEANVKIVAVGDKARGILARFDNSFFSLYISIQLYANGGHDWLSLLQF